VRISPSFKWASTPPRARPYPTSVRTFIASGVRSGKEQYRVIWLAKIENSVYVLHAFHKKSKHGIETPKHEKDIAEQRLKELKVDIARRSKTKGVIES
jgi:phage-related protein